MSRPIRFFTTGPHAHRSPLAYPALAPLFAGRVERVDTPEAADLHLYAHVLDIDAAPDTAVLDWRARQRPVVLLSEEPFWDTIWGRRPLEPRLVREARAGALPVAQLNHVTSAIFRFDRIPYYLLTDHRFANAYAARFARNAGVTPADWQARFAAAPLDAAFMFERRPEPFHAIAWPEAGLYGLCSWRTELAEAYTFGEIARLGSSWQGGPTRFEIGPSLGDWHLDKLVRLDGRARILGAVENTHQRDYLTEKLFDAFACGALPVYVADPGHRVHDLGLPEGSWANLWGMSPADGAARLADWSFDAAFFDAYAEAQARLAALFGDTLIWVRERDRLADAVLETLEAVLDGATGTQGR
ncbi:hypothetical protein [Chachezhania sediminis]|uniref:hypothetical protein n=1 Tax=Chachezhania sediminis TaxID=2599291 RepID=UPI00131D6086|nr:hypothetical protein [Chachezhania sediminis]